MLLMDSFFFFLQRENSIFFFINNPNKTKANKKKIKNPLKSNMQMQYCSPIHSILLLFCVLLTVFPDLGTYPPTREVYFCLYAQGILLKITIKSSRVNYLEKLFQEFAKLVLNIRFIQTN